LTVAQGLYFKAFNWKAVRAWQRTGIFPYVLHSEVRNT